MYIYFFLFLHAQIKVKINKPLTGETPIFSTLLLNNVPLLLLPKQQNTIRIVTFIISSGSFFTLIILLFFFFLNFTHTHKIPKKPKPYLKQASQIVSIIPQQSNILPCPHDLALTFLFQEYAPLQLKAVFYLFQRFA